MKRVVVNGMADISSIGYDLLGKKTGALSTRFFIKDYKFSIFPV